MGARGAHSYGTKKNGTNYLWSGIIAYMGLSCEIICRPGPRLVDGIEKIKK